MIGNARYHDVRGEIPPQTYVNLDSVVDGVSRISVYARVSGDPRQTMPLLRDEARRIDPNIVITGMRTLDDQIDTRMSNERMLSLLSIGFALLATVLAVVGVHGVLVFQIAMRTREIGVRMALGAGRGLIVGLVAREMALVILAGLAVGVATAYASGRFIQNQLFDLRADDPLVFAIGRGHAPGGREPRNADPCPACVAHERRARTTLRVGPRITRKTRKSHGLHGHHGQDGSRL